MQRFLVFCICLMVFALRPVFAERETAGLQQSLDDFISHFQEQYGLKLVYQNPPSSLWVKALYHPAHPKDYGVLLKYLELFEEEIKKYPQAFWAKSQLVGFVFVKKLFYKKRPVEGFYDYRRHFIFLDFMRSDGYALLQRHNLHHEIFHMVDVQMAVHPLGWKDPVWLGLNGKNFRYGQKQPPKEDDSPDDLFEPPYSGFMSRYATSSIEEDKAEVFACLMVESQNKILTRWMEKDEILRKKVQRIKTIISNYCEDMNEKYWVNLFQHSERTND